MEKKLVKTERKLFARSQYCASAVAKLATPILVFVEKGIAISSAMLNIKSISIVIATHFAIIFRIGFIVCKYKAELSSRH